MKTRAKIEPVMNEIIITYKNGISEIRNYIESAKSQKIKLAENQDERTVQEIEKSKQIEKINGMKLNVINEVKNIIDKYSESENEFFKLDGKEITDDIKLLSLPLTSEQVAELQNRYKNNFTMLQTINDYAKKNNLPVYRLQSKENRIDILNFWNDKVIYPRFADNTYFQEQESKYDFLQIAESYKQLYLPKFEELEQVEC